MFFPCNFFDLEAVGMIASAPFMSCQTNQLFDQAVIASLEFAREGGVIAGSVPVAKLERLADALFDRSGSLECELRGGRDGEGKPFLDLRVVGSVNLLCQRCLSSLSYPLDIESRLLLVAPGAEWPDDELEDDGPDAIEASVAQAVLPLVEDEVLLALPIAPRHEDCQPPIAAEEHRPSPFAVLAKLKDH